MHLLPAEEGAQGAGALLEVGVRGLRVEVAQILARVEPVARRIHVGRWRRIIGENDGEEKNTQKKKPRQHGAPRQTR